VADDRPHRVGHGTPPSSASISSGPAGMVCADSRHVLLASGLMSGFMLSLLILRRALPRRRYPGLLLAAVLAVAGTPTAALAAVPLVAAKPALTVGFDGLVYASAYVGTTVYVGGSFRNAIVDGKPVPRKRLAAVDARAG